jgi:hypothetical protein
MAAVTTIMMTMTMIALVFVYPIFPVGAFTTEDKWITAMEWNPL